MKFLFVTLFSVFALFSPGWGLDMEQAKTEAKAEHKLILLYFSGSDWCGPCIKLKKDIYESEEFGAFANEHLVLVKADFPRQKKNQLDKKQTQHNEALAEKYNNKGKFPFSVLINADGKVLKEWDGYPKDLSIASLKEEIKAYL
ncbi:thioredoxin family protein [Lacihabitans lacunae]|uniref:Thioredoxin family protein n=1 Tax=Lacihabitans lacunae TaxID=1028214 RepID=A0ABV7YY69_9BACT